MELLDSVVWHYENEKMPGLNYALGSATLIPLAGVLLGVISPAKYTGRLDSIAQKKTQQKPGRARII